VRYQACVWAENYICPRPHWGAYSAPPDPHSSFWGLLLKGGKRRAEEGRERRGRGEERRGEDVRGGETERGERREGARPLPREEKEKSAPIFSNITVM